MSYDFRILNKKNKKTVNTKGKPCSILCYGGTIRVHPEDMSPCQVEDFDFNMTYNYAPLLYKYIGKKEGIRHLYGRNFMECLHDLEIAIKNIRMDYINVLDKDVAGRDPTKKKWVEFLKDYTYVIPKKSPTIKQMEKQNPITDDYWACTPNNVIKALQHIVNCMYWIIQNYKFNQYSNFTFDGD